LRRRELAALTRNLGGEMIKLEGESVADALTRFAHDQQATFVVMGQPTRSRFTEILRGSLITEIMRRMRDVDVLVAGNREREERSA
jgi:two-component system sensor histidine kinase KdpD